MGLYHTGVNQLWLRGWHLTSRHSAASIVSGVKNRLEGRRRALSMLSLSTGFVWLAKRRTSLNFDGLSDVTLISIGGLLSSPGESISSWDEDLSSIKSNVDYADLLFVRSLKWQTGSATELEASLLRQVTSICAC